MVTYTRKNTSLIHRVKTLLTLLILSLISTNLSAQIPSTYCDGNPDDWANFQTTYPVNGYKLDPANAVNNTDDQFTQGSKDEQLLSQWNWSLGSANAKGDITNAAAALVNGCILRFAADRTSDNGDASIGFWFFRSAVTKNSNGTFNGSHTDGDILILSDFTSGGTQPTIKIYEWINGALVLQSASTARCADVNHIERDVPAGFTYTAANGSTKYAPNLFFEGAIDLCALNIPACFSYFLVETRNSQSITASLQDFAANTFNANPPAPQATVTQPTCTVRTGTITVTSPTGTGYSYSKDGTTFQNSPVFSGLAAGNYTITVKTASNCTNTAQFTVNTAPPIPTTPQATVTQPTCTVATGTITVTSPTGTGYSYSKDGTTFQNSPVFSGLAAGNYTITVKNSDGCTNTAQFTVNTQPATPSRPVITIQEATLCGTLTAPTLTVSCPVSGHTYTLTQTGVAGSQTFTYNGSNGPVVFTVQAGKKFSITATNTAGCTSAATDCDNYTTVTCPSTITKADVQKVELAAPTTKVLAAPNPFSNRVRFQIESSVSGMGSLELYNTMGQKVATVYQGYVEAGRTLNKEYIMNRVTHNSLIYVFRVGDQKTTGKLLNW